MSRYSVNTPIIVELYALERATTFYLELGLHSNVAFEGNVLAMIKEIYMEEECQSFIP